MYRGKLQYNISLISIGLLKWATKYLVVGMPPEAKSVCASDVKCRWQISKKLSVFCKFLLYVTAG